MPNALRPEDEQEVLAAGIAIATVAAGDADPKDVARIAVRRMQRLVDADVAAIFLRAQNGHHELVSACGPAAGRARTHWRHGLTVRGRRLIAHALAPLDGLATAVILPLRARGRIIGAFAIAHTTPDQRAARSARRFAALIAEPLEKCMLAAELRVASEAAVRQADLDGTLRAILAGVRRVVPADAAGILVREGDVARVIAVDGHPDEALGHCLPVARDESLEGPLLQGVSVHIDEPGWAQYGNSAPGAQRIRSYLGVPLMAGDDVAGILCLDSWSPGAFDREDLRRAGQFGAHVGTALVHARAYSLSVAEAVALREAALLATHDPGADDILHRILEGLRHVIACDGASVILRESLQARIVAMHGHPETVMDHAFDIAGHSTLETPLLDGRPFLTPDLSAEPTYTPAPGAMSIKGHLSVPLVARGEILGMLAVDSTRRAAFGTTDVAHVELFAGYVAAALVNARMHSAVRQAAERDPVTGLYNHRAIHDRLDRALAHARLSATPLAVAMLDLDGFKLYNDTHGHPAGDAALQTVAAALEGACRHEDIVGRYGGDEFLVVLPDLPAHEAEALGARLRDAVAARTLRPTKGRALPLRVSIGVACFPQDGADRDLLVARADARLYESKQHGEVVAGASAEQTPVMGVGDAFGVLDGLVTAVDRKDRYTRAHSEQVTRLALLLGAELGLSSETLRSVRLAGLLHDVGKIGVPDRILKKPGRLTPEEVETMNGHPTLGEAIVAGLPDLSEIRTGVRSHHERWDGRGYPDGLAGEAIPLLGRLLAVPDCYSAMTTDRPYRAALSHAAALAEIKRQAGARFDPMMAEAFMRALRRGAGRLTDLAAVRERREA